MTRFFRSRRTGGFSFAEVLVAAAIVGILAAVAVPLTLRQQARSTEVTVRADLISASTTIETVLRAWRGKSPGVWLYICHTPYNAQYPTSTPRPHTCLDNEWIAKTAAGTEVRPPMNGQVADSVRIQGVVAPDGSYCLDGSSTKAGVNPYRLTSDTAQAVPGTCLDAEWVPTGGIRGNTRSGWGSQPAPGMSANPVPTASAASLLPDAPLNLKVCIFGQAAPCAGTMPGRQQATITWNAQPGVTYRVSVSGQPSRDTSIGTGFTAECRYPANKCTGPFTGLLPTGPYKVEVKQKNSKGWGAPAVAFFTIS